MIQAPIHQLSLTSIAMLLVLFSCKKEEKLPTIKPTDKPYPLEIPYRFPVPNIPPDNELTLKRVELGKKLFYDPMLSETGTLSCASCHIPEHAFSDTTAKSIGVHGRLGARNAPTLANVAYKNDFFADGGSHTLELQAMSPIQDSNEMNLDFLQAIERIKQNPEYVKLSQIAYHRQPDGFVLTRALAAFQRTLLSGNSKYDQYLQGKTNLTPSEENGKNLFFSNQTNCSSCHGGFAFTNFEYENIGLYETYSDIGRMRITFQENDRGKFMTPTLRNIAVTAPYMHDGSIATLSEVIEFFNSGGHSHYNKSTQIQPLHLTEQEKIDLEKFLLTLTDQNFLQNQRHKP